MVDQLFDRADSSLSVLPRVARALRRWLSVATYLSLIAVVLYALTGGAVLQKYGSAVTLPRVLVIYYLGSALSGSLAGLLTPLTATLRGTIVASVASMIPVGLMIGMLLRGLSLRDPVLGVGALGFGVVMGLMYGAIDWHYRDR